MVRVYTQQAGQTTLGGLFGGGGPGPYKPFCMRLPYTESGTARDCLPQPFHPEVFPVHHQQEILERDSQPQESFRVPVAIGICKQCKKFYSPENGTGVDYEDLLNQKRRDEARYRQGGQFSSNLRSANSDGFLNRTPYNNTGGFNEELEDLSRALSRLQQTVAPDPGDLPQSFSYPTSAQPGLDSSHSRRTWSAPNKDPLDDPFKRRGPAQQQTSYQPSFGSGDSHQRGRRGQQDRRGYLQDLEQQMEEQRRRREREQREAGTDWWEKKKAPVTEFQAPHPNQSSYDRPDPAEVRKRYELELKEQMETKKRLDDEKKRKEREEEERFEKRLQEQQEKMAREFQEEQNKKKEKENAKRKKQEQIAKRQEEIKKEMDQRKREEELRKSEKRRSVSRQTNREDVPPPSEVPVRSSSPPIPTMRGRSEEVEVAEEVGTRPASPGVAETLHSMRENIERRRESLQYEEERLGGEWTGLAEL